jgi:hypothetical protein
LGDVSLGLAGVFFLSGEGGLELVGFGGVAVVPARVLLLLVGGLSRHFLLSLLLHLIIKA